MKPEEYLAFIESTASFIDAISHIRDGLIEKGWSSHGAESASLTVFTVSANGAKHD